MSFANLSPEARGLVERAVLLTLCQAAIEDCVMARISWEMRNFRSFGWNAGQCSEKLLKACLLFNGKSGNFSHPKFDDYKELINLAGNILCKPLQAPDGFRVLDDEAYDEPILHFINRLVLLGDTNLRYRGVEYRTEMYDLHKFDELVFRLSRCLIHLDELKEPTTNWRNFLKNNKGYTHDHFLTLLEPKFSEFFSKNNFSFCPQNSDHKESLAFGSGKNGLAELMACYTNGEMAGIEAHKYLKENSKIVSE